MAPNKRICCRLLDALIPLVLCQLGSCQPHCRETYRSAFTYSLYECSGFTETADFVRYVHRPLHYRLLEFVLEHARLDHLSPGSFDGTNATSLVLRNVTIGSLNSSAANLFVELRDTLETIAFEENSSLPKSWSALNHLGKLKRLRFVSMNQLKLTGDFNQLPGTIEAIEVVTSEIALIDDEWLSALHNLKEVSIQWTNLKSFSRTMLPRPAPEFWFLDLS